MGHDPATSVVDADCSRDLDNLWIADSSPFPSSAAVNPALTVAALACARPLRCADDLARHAPAKPIERPQEGDPP
jgi:choline dehydrogenase-like flavoprotein